MNILATGENVLELIRKGFPEEQAQRLETFAARLLARMPAEAAARLSTYERLELLRGAFEFFSTRAEPIKARATPGTADGEAVTVVESLMADCPFVVDSVREYFREIDAPVRLLLHPVLSVGRDPQGRIVSLEEARASERKESFIHAELEFSPAPPPPAEIAAELKRRLGEVLMAVSDFAAITSRTQAICDEMATVRELIEVRDFIRWLLQGSFVFLGYRRYLPGGDGCALWPDPASGLGILRADPSTGRPVRPELDALDSAGHTLLFEGPTLIVGKTRAQSHVHRRAPMDDIVIRRLGPRGEVAAFDRIVGLFTWKAYAEEAQHIPLLRAKLREVLEAERAMPGSHDFKEITATFDSFPKEELLRASVGELREQLGVILNPAGGDSVRVSLQVDANRGAVIVLVVMPRECFSYDIRVAIQQAIERRLGGSLVYFHVALGSAWGYTTRLHFCLLAPAPPATTAAQLAPEIARIARSWDDRLRDLLIERFGEGRGHLVSARWATALSADYKAGTEVARAATDIERSEAMLAGAAAPVELHPAPEANASELRMYELREPLVLSELVPLLQNFDIRVLSEDAHEFKLPVEGRTASCFVQAFRVQGPNRQPLDRMPGAHLVAEALSAVRSGLADNDPLNALTLSAGLAWREVALLRAYLAAAFQMKLAPARPALRRVFLQQPEIARLLIALFKARLDPERAADAEPAAELKASYLERLAAVETIADDRVARSLLGMVEATVRTNYFCRPQSNPCISLKFDSSRIADLRESGPLFEIHVRSPRMEGCHLRAGRVARGGIRYSDRPDDYRSEILSLMRTQTVKNAIIVPVGSKGGFIVKPPPGRAIGGPEVVEAYRTLIGAMLELTDNLVEGQVVHPAGLRVLDDDGPYLVVAADKGTAAFSDIANEIAEQRGFWLGDAFASGGRHGYDHKKLGITARGAWESVRRHLRELGRDPDRGAPITVAGIGDMSGDVFGNALLQSANLKLIAAFDHRHIFLDPDPNPAASYAERKRLYELRTSQWSDYNPALLSRGGGVFGRGQKRIELSPQVCAALKCEASALDGESLIRAILRAEVDLLYNGGIGTYVRASDESDAEAGDHANDACRVAASELRARVVVEGGNLGFTQKARVELALRGGRINTDAIDNSAGVDLSDHEVNLKILLQPALARRALTVEQRNRVLEQAEGEVAELVLRDNRDQVLLLSLEQIRSQTQVSTVRDLLSAIEQRGWLRREEAALPTREALRSRRARFAGLTRPELAVLTAYTKLDLARALEGSSLVDDPYLVDRYLRPYFPRSIAERFAAELPNHRLRRELIATQLTNELINLMGAGFVFGLARDYGAETDEAVRAWAVAAELLELRERAGRLRAVTAGLSVEAEAVALFALQRAAALASRWALALGPCDIGAVVGRFRPALQGLLERFEVLLAAGERERFERAYRELRGAGHGEESAHELARLAFADHLLDALRLSFDLGGAPQDAARIYFQLAQAIDFALLDGAIEAVSTDDRWERRAARELGDELRATRCRLARAAIANPPQAAAADLLAGLRPGKQRQFDEAQRLLAEIRTLTAVSVPALQVAVRAIARLA